MKIVSVIIPAYNRAPYIAEAIDSVLAQKLPKDWQLEIIVADDGSTDNTREIIEPYISKGLVEFYTLPHSGKPAVPRNYAIKKSRGDIIAFQDSDDLWATDKLKNQLKLFENGNAVLSFGNAEIMNSDGEKSGKLVVSKDELKNGEKLDTLLNNNVISTLTVMAKRRALEEAGLFSEEDDLRAVEDYALWLRVVALNPGKIKCVPETLAYYRVHDQNISSASNLLAVKRIISVLDNLFECSNLSNKQRMVIGDAIIEKNIVLGLALMDESPETKPAVSVIMSVYNGGIFLKAAIQSILDQSFKNFEFIIIDDGSSDDSANVIKSFNDSRIRLIRQTNSGLVASLNKAARISRADIIARMDADDISLPSRLEHEYLAMSSHENIGLVGTFFGYISEESKQLGTVIIAPTNNDDIKRLMRLVNPIGHGTAMYRKECIEEAGYYRDTYGPTEDYDLWRRFDKKWRFVIIPEVQYLYRINHASISHTNNKVQNEYADKIRHELWEDVGSFPVKSFYRIIRDAKKYRRADNIFSEQIYQTYAGNQVDIAWELLQRSRLKSGYITAFASLVLRPKSIKKLAQPMLLAVPKRLSGR
jgi:glycosyltransferase involved in cell wall biosynthesis